MLISESSMASMRGHHIKTLSYNGSCKTGPPSLQWRDLPINGRQSLLLQELVCLGEVLAAKEALQATSPAFSSKHMPGQIVLQLLQASRCMFRSRNLTLLADSPEGCVDLRTWCLPTAMSGSWACAFLPHSRNTRPFRLADRALMAAVVKLSQPFLACELASCALTVSAAFRSSTP